MFAIKVYCLFLNTHKNSNQEQCIYSCRVKSKYNKRTILKYTISKNTIFSKKKRFIMLISTSENNFYEKKIMK